MLVRFRAPPVNPGVTVAPAKSSKIGTNPALVIPFGPIGPIAARPAAPTLRALPVQFPGAAATVLLPVAGGGAAAAFQRYVATLATRGSFEDQGEALQRLQAAGAQASSAPEPSGERPRIGIVLAEPEQLLVGGDHTVAAMIEKVRARGGEPVLIPPMAHLLVADTRPAREGAIAALLGTLDGVLGPGGDDVHPRIYGQRNRYAEETNYPRDRFEADFAVAALRSDVYMLGVCRSHQLWNAAAGGALVQDVEKEGYSSLSQRQRDFGIPLSEAFVLRDDAGGVIFENRVQLDPKSRFYTALGRRRSVLTNSSHHQAVSQPGRGFRAVGVVIDPKDGTKTIEATESRNALTVQWHPELLSRHEAGDALFDVLVRRAEIFRIVRQRTQQGLPVDSASISKVLGAHARYAFDASDHAWVARDVGADAARAV